MSEAVLSRVSTGIPGSAYRFGIVVVSQLGRRARGGFRIETEIQQRAIDRAAPVTRFARSSPVSSVPPVGQFAATWQTLLTVSMTKGYAQSEMGSPERQRLVSTRYVPPSGQTGLASQACCAALKM
jgi:hypothetical protein